VNEHVGPAVRRLDEAEAFRGIEPFHCPSSPRDFSLGWLL